MAGDRVRQLELPPIVAFVVDQSFTLGIVHAQRQQLGADVDDLAGLAVEAHRLIVVLAHDQPVSEAEYCLADTDLRCAGRRRVQAGLECRIQRAHPDRCGVLRRDDLRAEAHRAFDDQPLGMDSLILARGSGAQDVHVARRGRARHGQLAVIDGVGGFDDRRALALAFDDREQRERYPTAGDQIPQH